MANPNRYHLVPDENVSLDGYFSPSMEEGVSSCDVIDDAKRSVSFRINTSDYGRIKTIARNKKVRESDVFRYLLRACLNALTPLYGSHSNNTDVLKSFADNSVRLLDDLILDQRRLNHQISHKAPNEMSELETSDIELLALSLQPLRYLASQLTEKTGRTVDAGNAVNALHEYLEAKYDWRSSTDEEGQAQPRD